MKLTPRVQVNGIGNVSNCYTWQEIPSLNGMSPKDIKNPLVSLPEGITLETFSRMREEVQQAVVSRKGIAPDSAARVSLNLSGIVIESPMPCQAGVILRDQSSDVEIHYIFQTGLNLAGVGGGGIPHPRLYEAEPDIELYSKKNARAALSSAVRNQSDVLVFNLGIGAGFFAGRYGCRVKEANVRGIIQAVQEVKSKGERLEVIVPNIGLTSSQIKDLTDAGICIIGADKDAVAALCAQEGYKVSLTIGADPMSILGIHGPGFWWETVGSASDEERAAYLSPCYVLGHIPINVCSENGSFEPTKIAALSEFMVPR